MEVIETCRGLEITGIRDFDPMHTFDCGQAFRWNNHGNGYTGVVGDRVVRIYTGRQTLYIDNADIREYDSLWRDYLDLNRDYDAIKTCLARDPVMKEAMKYGWGIHILNQEPWETLISFIISANNNITRIKAIIERLSKSLGRRIPTSLGEFYTFPGPESLATARESVLKACGCGYRGRYIQSAAQMVMKGDIRLQEIKALSCSEAHSRLLTIPGVGPKVADCIMLFSMGKSGVFPTDVWIKRIMEHFYIGTESRPAYVKQLGQQKFGNLAGFAQQYLFYYARELGLGR